MGARGSRRTRSLPLEPFGQSSFLSTPLGFFSAWHISSLIAVSVIVGGCSFIVCNSCGPPKAWRLNGFLSTRISEQSSVMAVARDGRRRMSDERLVGECKSSRMTITRYRGGRSRAEEVENAEAGGSQTRRENDRTSVNYSLWFNGRLNGVYLRCLEARAPNVICRIHAKLFTRPVWA